MVSEAGGEPRRQVRPVASYRPSVPLSIGGVYPPVATPFKANEDIDYDKLHENMVKWNQLPFRGYVVQGSNGEYVSLSAEERVEVVRRVKADVPAGKILIAGSSCEGTRETIALTKKMAGAGADAVLVLPPCYFKSSMTGAAMREHFLAVADTSPVPLVLYNMPANTGLDIPPEVCIALAEHPNVIGLKDSGGDVTRIGSIIHKTRGKGFEVLAGSAGFLYPALCIGATGGVCALANMAGAECCEIVEHFNAGRHAEALALNERLILANASVTRKMGVPALKLAMEWRGYYGGPTRAPLLPLTDVQVENLRADMEGSGLMAASKL